MLYVGIDIGKTGHVAALISPELLKRHERYDACPVMRVENMRAGFVSLLAAMQAHASPAQCHVLMEHTGHYGEHLRSYLGWSPRQSQTGSTYDSVKLDKSGNSLLKQTMYLVALSAIRHDPSWRALYLRVVERKCDYNARTKRHMGKMKVVGRIAGQFIGVLYLLLRKDFDMLANLPQGTTAPPPQLYDPARHIVALGDEKAGGVPH